MVQAWLVAVALGLGLLIGIGIASLLVWAALRGAVARRLVSEEMPDGLVAVLAVLGVPAILVNGSNLVLAQSPSAAAAGLVADRVHPLIAKRAD